MIDTQHALHQANVLRDLMGQRAEAEAAARAARERRSGNVDEAADWDRIRGLLKERRAPRQS